MIKKLSDSFFEKGELFDVMTPVYKLRPENIHNPNYVKVLLSHDLDAIYFSRLALPYIRGIEKERWYEMNDYWGHIGIYLFKANVLSKWFKLPISKLEKLEKLEQLRFIDAKLIIKTIRVESETFSIDTQEQLIKAREIANSVDKI